MFRLGPDVSLSGSPTVSPVTAALKICDFFVLTLPLTTTSGSSSAIRVLRAPLEMYFLALSHAPPVLEDEMAICTPDAIAPASRPVTQRVPKTTPQTMGESITRAPGAIISWREASVEILMPASKGFEQRASLSDGSLCKGRGLDSHGRTGVIVRAVRMVGDEEIGVEVELALDLEDHRVGGHADRLHRHRREPVRQHRADQ